MIVLISSIKGEFKIIDLPISFSDWLEGMYELMCLRYFRGECR